MNILVAGVESMGQYPPILALCETLLELGHRVTVMERDCAALPQELRNNPNMEIIDLGKRPSGALRVLDDIAIENKVKRYCINNAEYYDLVWTTSDISARACGRALFRVKHVMQLMELAEYVPAVTVRDMPFHSLVVPELARRAHRVVVPEYNRAFIQQAWWRLERRPAVLPNKSVLKSSDSDNPVNGISQEIYSKFKSEKRKIILYQGVFSADRDFSKLIAAMDVIGQDYALYLMGVKNCERERIEALRDGRKNVVLIPFVPAPLHLAVTKFGHIGLLPYKPVYGRQSPLNALYCAPNKVWEYSKYGLPMIGSEVPGLSSLFSIHGLGVTCDIDNVAAFVRAVQQIESDYETYSNRSQQYFDSVDLSELVQKIVEGD